MDVVSKVCGPAAGAIPIIKREAEAEAEPWLGLAGHAIGAPYVAHHGLAPLAAPITTCKVVQSVDCTPVVSKVPKQNCEQVETEVPVAPALPALGYGGYGAYGAGLW